MLPLPPNALAASRRHGQPARRGRPCTGAWGASVVVAAVGVAATTVAATTTVASILSAGAWRARLHAPKAPARHPFSGGLHRLPGVTPLGNHALPNPRGSSAGELRAVRRAVLHQVEAGTQRKDQLPRQTIDSLRIAARLKKKIKKIFALTNMTAVQTKAISASFENRDFLARSEGGQMEWLPFLIPILQKTGMEPARHNGPIRSLILTPEPDACIDIAEAARRLLPPGEKLGVFSMRGSAALGDEQLLLRVAPCGMLVATPKRLQEHLRSTSGFRERLQNLQFLVLSQADLLVKHFGQEVTELQAALSPSPKRRSCMFSETFDTGLCSFAGEILRPEYLVIDSELDDGEDLEGSPADVDHSDREASFEPVLDEQTDKQHGDGKGLEGSTADRNYSGREASLEPVLAGQRGKEHDGAEGSEGSTADMDYSDIEASLEPQLDEQPDKGHDDIQDSEGSTADMDDSGRGASFEPVLDEQPDKGHEDVQDSEGSTADTDYSGREASLEPVLAGQRGKEDDGAEGSEGSTADMDYSDVEASLEPQLDEQPDKRHEDVQDSHMDYSGREASSEPLLDGQTDQEHDDGKGSEGSTADMDHSDGEASLELLLDEQTDKKHDDARDLEGSTAGADYSDREASSESELDEKPNKEQAPSASSNKTAATSRRFDELQISEATKRLLREELHFTTMTEVQVQAIPAILQGHDVILKAKTGTGKTAAFTIPIVEQLGRLPPAAETSIFAVILAPTRELVAQIADVVIQLVPEEQDTKVLTLMGGMSSLFDDQIQMQEGGRFIVVAAAGRFEEHLLNSPGFLHMLQHVQVIVLDEADNLLCNSHKKVMDILEFLPPAERRQGLFMSATFSDTVLDLAKDFLRPGYKVIDMVAQEAEATPSQIRQSYAVLEIEDMARALWHLLQQEMARHTGKAKIIVFFATARLTQYYTEVFRNLGIGVSQLHKRMKQSSRFAGANKFWQAHRGILFTTDLSARGMDYPDVTTVIQFGAPFERTTYVHRLGRTGRMESHGRSVLLLHDFERPFLAKLEDLPLKEMATSDLESRMPAPEELGEPLSELRVGQAYKDWLRHYRFYIPMYGWTREQLVATANRFAASLGAVRENSMPPPIRMTQVEKLGLMDVEGLDVVEFLDYEQPIPRGHNANMFPTDLDDDDAFADENPRRRHPRNSVPPKEGPLWQGGGSRGVPQGREPRDRVPSRGATLFPTDLDDRDAFADEKPRRRHPRNSLPPEDMSPWQGGGSRGVPQGREPRDRVPPSEWQPWQRGIGRQVRQEPKERRARQVDFTREDRPDSAGMSVPAERRATTFPTNLGDRTSVDKVPRHPSLRFRLPLGERPQWQKGINRKARQGSFASGEPRKWWARHGIFAKEIPHDIPGKSILRKRHNSLFTVNLDDQTFGDSDGSRTLQKWKPQRVAEDAFERELYEASQAGEELDGESFDGELNDARLAAVNAVKESKARMKAAANAIIESKARMKAAAQAE